MALLADELTILNFAAKQCSPAITTARARCLVKQIGSLCADMEDQREFVKYINGVKTMLLQHIDRQGTSVLVAKSLVELALMSAMTSIPQGLTRGQAAGKILIAFT